MDLSVRLYSSKSTEAVVWTYWREAICTVVDLTGIYGVAPGFDGGMNVMADRVLYIAGDKVKYMRPRALSSRLE